MLFWHHTQLNWIHPSVIGSEEGAEQAKQALLKAVGKVTDIVSSLGFSWWQGGPPHTQSLKELDWVSRSTYASDQSDKYRDCHFYWSAAFSLHSSKHMSFRLIITCVVIASNSGTSSGSCKGGLRRMSNVHVLVFKGFYRVRILYHIVPFRGFSSVA